VVGWLRCGVALLLQKERLSSAASGLVFLLTLLLLLLVVGCRWTLSYCRRQHDATRPPLEMTKQLVLGDEHARTFWVFESMWSEGYAGR